MGVFSNASHLLYFRHSGFECILVCSSHIRTAMAAKPPRRHDALSDRNTYDHY